MLANKKAMSFFVDFLKSTEVGSREKVREQELEWQQRSDQASNDLHERLVDLGIIRR